MIKSWLKELKLDEDDLTLGSAWPLSPKRKDYIVRHEGRKSKVYHNCSGKHCGQLSICIHQKFKTLNYQDPKHPVQKLFIQNLEKLSETKINHIGIDGCGNMKAAEIAIAGLLRDLKILQNDEVKKLINQPILNSAGKRSGKMYWISEN